MPLSPLVPRRHPSSSTPAGSLRRFECERTPFPRFHRLSRCKMAFLAPPGCPTGIQRASSRFRECSPPPPPPPGPFWLARGAVHPILYDSLLSATSLPPVTLPRGAVQAGLLSSKPTPFYKYITRPSALAIPCPLSFLVLSRFSLLRRSFVRAVSR